MHRGNFRRQGVSVAGQYPVLPDIEAEGISLGQAESDEVVLGDAGPDGEAGGSHEFKPEQYAEEVDVLEDGPIAVLGEVAGDLYGIRSESDAEGGSFGDAVGGEGEFVQAGGAVFDPEFEDIQDPDEAGDKFVGRLLIYFAGSANLFEAATPENDNAVGDFHGLLLVMGDEDGGDGKFTMQVDQPVAEFLSDPGIDRTKGFIKEQDGRFWCESAGDGDALALAAGELVRKTPGKPLKFEERKQFLDPGCPFGSRPLLDLEAEGNVVEDRHGLEQGVALKDEANVALLDADVVDPFAADQDVSVGRLFESGNHPKHGGLASATGTEQGHEFTFPNTEGDGVHGSDLAEPFRDVA